MVGVVAVTVVAVVGAMALVRAMALVVTVVVARAPVWFPALGVSVVRHDLVLLPRVVRPYQRPTARRLTRSRDRRKDAK